MSASQDGIPTTEGKLPFKYQGQTYETYYKVVGNLDDTSGVPLVALHGGPGVAHYYLLALSDLLTDRTGTNAGIFYDQLGSGQSSHPRDSVPASFWTPELFME